MVARLALMEDVQKENQNLKVQNEKLTNRCEQLSKNVCFRIVGKCVLNFVSFL